ncbi:pre-mRNA-splicing factor ATP-dependent RNA helicase [Achlya hypogyna]|uniref:RNA helicase n=1 Tax=Achlya hypogyna TaxID=1202772 RepID=A0A1V9ZQZ5_ACHHY|nr:pre-mRNA-splicing factor ATP-dependent RNA helicase [Achlya hypogyna]
MAARGRSREKRRPSRSPSRDSFGRSYPKRRSSPEKDSRELDFQSQRAMLPVGQYKAQLLDAIAANQIIVCIGETGSGKTTQLPQFLLEAGYGESKRIGITQPRRVATTAVAKRVGEELAASGTSPSTASYTIRFDDQCTAATKIKFMTDGILVRECLLDPLLTQYSIIMLDEAHERSIHTDILFGLLKSILVKRPDLKLIVTSATLDDERFAAFFNGCPVFRVPGRSFPVDIYHSKTHQIMGKAGPVSTYIAAAVDAVLQIHAAEPDGHILLFLTGQKEIDDACQMLTTRVQRLRDDDPAVSRLLVLPLYGALSSAKQRRIFEPTRDRKVIVCTNIAETSLTVDGVKYVVDAGFTKQKVYNPERGLESLVVVPISQVSAQQRAGRAGRTSAGKCYRLYSKQSYETMLPETVPEIQRSNLANTILYLKVLGIHDVVGFDYLDPPAEDAIVDALRQLYILGALDERGVVTATGKDMAQFPLEPRLARVLLEGIRLDCAREAMIVVAMLSVENVFMFQTDRRTGDDPRAASRRRATELLDALQHPKGDHISLLQLFRAWDALPPHEQEAWCHERQLHSRAFRTAASVRSQLEELVAKVARGAATQPAPALPVTERIQRAVCAGYFMHGARKCLMHSVFRCLHLGAADDSTAELVHIHPSSSLAERTAPEHCIYHELVHTSRSFMRHVLEVDGSWLEQYKPTKLLKLSECYGLTGRNPPQALLDEEKKTVAATEALAPPKLAKVEPVKVTEDAVSAARARYLARQQQQQKTRKTR